MEVGKLTVFHSCLSTCVKQQVSLGQAFRLCLCTIMLTANCGGTRHRECTTTFGEDRGRMGRFAKSLVGVNLQDVFPQDVLGRLR